MIISRSVRKDHPRNAEDTERDCGQKICSMEYHFEPTCTVYVDQSATKLCNYPCSMEFCTSEIHHFIDCPVWNCVDKSSTPVPFSTLKPASEHHACTTPLCISSVTLNVLFVLALLTITSLFLKKRCFRNTGNHSFENPHFTDPESGPIFRPRQTLSTEYHPLLAVAGSTGSLERQPATLPVSTPTVHSSSEPNITVSLTPGSELDFHEGTF